MMTSLTSHSSSLRHNRTNRTNRFARALPRAWNRALNSFASAQRRKPNLCEMIAAAAIAVCLLSGTVWASPLASDLSGPDVGIPRLALRAENVGSGPSLGSASLSQIAPPGDIEERALPAADCCSVRNGIRGCDEIYVISTRAIGCNCDPAVLLSALRCERYVPGESGCCAKWQHADLMKVLTAHDSATVTVFYVHGNQIAAGQAKCRGLTNYRRLVQCGSCDQPIRFIVFSWPSTTIKGPLKDARVKAARTRPAGCQLAWIVDQMPGDLPIGMIGYSYGSRIITGALHVLGGGRLSGLGLSERANPDRRPIRVVLTASALHAHWLGPGQYHGRAMTQVDEMLLINNRDDRAMRFYHLSTTNGSPQALGLCGPTCIGQERHKIRSIDVSRCVGPNHVELKYLSVPGTACRFWEYAVAADSDQ